MAVRPNHSIHHKSCNLQDLTLTFQIKVTRITFCPGLKVVWMEELHIQSVLLRIVIASVQTYKKKYFINIGICRIKIKGSLL